MFCARCGKLYGILEASVRGIWKEAISKVTWPCALLA